MRLGPRPERRLPMSNFSRNEQHERARRPNGAVYPALMVGRHHSPRCLPLCTYSRPPLARSSAPRFAWPGPS